MYRKGKQRSAPNREPLQTNSSTSTNVLNATEPNSSRHQVTRTSTINNEELSPNNNNINTQLPTNVNDDGPSNKRPRDQSITESDEIPASQPATQRTFYTQRTASTTMMSGSVSRVTNQIPTIANKQSIGNSYFERVLSKCDIDINSSDSFILDSDHIIIVNKIRNHLKSHSNYPQNIQRFLKELGEAMKDTKTLTKLLTSCTIKNNSRQINKQSLESLIKDFLMIDFLQTDIIKMLFERMLPFATKAENTLGMPFLEMLLSQLVFVDHFTNGDLIFNEIFKLLDVTLDLDSKQQIIKLSTYIIPLQSHDEFIKKLLIVVPNKSELFTELILNAFGNMCISTPVHLNVTTQIMNYIRSNKSPMHLLPAFTKFILTFNVNDKATNFQPILKEFHDCLKWDRNNGDDANPNTNTTDEDNQRIIRTNQLDVFNNIQLALTASKKLYELWFKTIQSNIINSECHSIDILLLIIMQSINSDKSNYIEHWLRIYIKSERIDVQLFEETIENNSFIIKQYFNTFLTFIDNCFLDKHSLVINLACHSYKLLFGLPDCDRKLLLSKLIRLICAHNQKLDIRKNDSVLPDVRTQALQVLNDINKKYPIEMQHCGLQLLLLLDRSDEFTLFQYRTIMNILCAIIYPKKDEVHPLQDDIDILIRKQISSSIVSVKKQGIIGIIRVIDHIIWTNVNDCDDDLNFDTTDNFNSIMDLPEGVARTAGGLMDLIFASTTNNPELLSLCYDEISIIISHKNKQNDRKTRCNKAFLIWLSDTLTSIFENHFISTQLPTDCRDIEMDYQYCINVIEEFTSDTPCITMAINISENILKPTSSAESSIGTLSSLFNLLRNILFHRYNGNLEGINAVLGCAVMLPKFFNQNDYELRIFNDYDQVRLYKIFDMHFYTINWIREIIGAYVSQDISLLRKKVLTRLNELIKLEDKVRTLLQMQTTDDYIPPVCEFLLPSTKTHKFKKPNVPPQSSKKVSGTTKKDLINKGIQNNNNITAIADNDGTETIIYGTMAQHQNLTNSCNLSGKINSLNKSKTSTMQKINPNRTYGPKEIYRQMDPDIMLLLNENLIIEYPLEQNRIGYAIGLLEFKFILEDLVIKLESLTGVKRFTVDQPIQNILHPIEFIKDIIKFLPRIQECYKQLTDYLIKIINSDLNETNTIDRYSDEANLVKICFGLCIRLQVALFSWPLLDDNIHGNLLKDSLKTIANYSVFDTNPETITTKDMTIKAFENVLKCKKFLLDFRSAVHLYHLIKSLIKFIPDSNAYVIKMVNLCEEFLSKKWYSYDGQMERGTQYNLLLDELLKGVFIKTNLTKILKILGWLNSEVKYLKQRNDVLKTFPSISKLNFPLLYRNLCIALISTINTKIELGGTSMVQINYWEKGCEILYNLLEINKVLPIPRNFSLFLRYAHLFIKLFLKHAIPIIELCLRQNADRVIQLIRNLQQTTRYLHNLCCHSKAIKNYGIIAQIPYLRETTEKLVFRVKAVLAANKCSSGFTMGNLKNKDLHGDEILSQVSTMTNEDNEEEEEDDDILPPDDDDVDEIEQGLNQQSSFDSTDNDRISDRTERSSIF